MAESQRHFQATGPPSVRSPDVKTHGISNGAEQKRFGAGANSVGHGPAESVRAAGKDAGSPSGVSVTVLTLDASPRPAHTSNHNYNSNGAVHTQQVWAGDMNMTELKYVRDFQVRRKYGRRSTSFQTPRREQPYLELGLSGTKYFDGNKEDSSNSSDNNNNSSSSTTVTNDTTNNSSRTAHTDAGNAHALNSPRLVKRSTTSLLDSADTFTLSGSLSVSPTTEHITSVRDGKRSADSAFNTLAHAASGTVYSMHKGVKDLNSPLSTSFPPLSATPRGGARSENSFYASRNPLQSSLLMNDFGFNTVRTDTFSGLKRQRRLKNGTIPDSEDLFRELEQHAQKQLLACQNMGYFHRGSRAAENVLSLKETVSPNAFHPPAFFTRHAPKTDDRGTSRGGEEEKRGLRRLTPAGKLCVPRVAVQDRQDHAARGSTLPYVSGSSLQAMLAQAHAK